MIERSAAESREVAKKSQLQIIFDRISNASLDGKTICSVREKIFEDNITKLIGLGYEIDSSKGFITTISWK